MQMRELQEHIDADLAVANTKTAWRIDGTLREFPKFKPVNLWFDYPIHHTDQSGVLDDIQPEDEKPNWKKGLEARKKQGESQRKNKQAKVDMAIESFKFEHHDTSSVPGCINHPVTGRLPIQNDCPNIAGMQRIPSYSVPVFANHRSRQAQSDQA